MSTSFPDELHVERIADALWQRRPAGNAAVMVGAGFSRNAQPRLPHDQRPPTWRELAAKLHAALFPMQLERSISRPTDGQEWSQGTGDFLRLAQMYEATFGATALEELLTKAVGDERQEPAELHELLLWLPWSDVFTTNWDTLLERTAPRVLDRRFDVITLVEEIPRSSRPRIVKLHGSLPSTRPLIITEEHYRTYPARFAPFVNLAQQSMMENVFCLLGFSGDDPNFLAWSGWVRDHLGDSAPSLYLVGWLNLTHAERRLLEDRRVIPVDLASLEGASDWSKDTRHALSLEWFLRRLKASRPPSPLDWPAGGSLRDEELSPYLPPLETRHREFPQAEPAGPKDGEDPVIELRKAQDVWRRNRTLYPGWLIAPRLTRERIWLRTSPWLSTVLDSLPRLEPHDRLRLLYEVNWRFELSLTPLYDDVAASIRDALETAVTSQSEFGADVEAHDSPPFSLHTEWISLAFAMLRYARESGQDTAFEKWYARITQASSQGAESSHRLEYERCLFLLARLRYAELRSRLAQWETPGREPVWVARKAVLLAQAGLIDEASELSRAALSEVRSRQPRASEDLPGLSQEGWMMLLSEAFDFHRRMADRDQNDAGTSAPSAERDSGILTEPNRWKTLKEYGTDPWDELLHFHSVLEAAPPRPPADRELRPTFDPWRRTVAWRGLRFGGGDPKELPALRFVRLCEEAPLPPVAPFTGLTASMLLRSVVWLQSEEPLRASTVLLLTASNDADKILDAYFSRLRLARMDQREVERIRDSLLSCLEFGIDCLSSEHARQSSKSEELFWLERLRVAMELLSRLTIRADVLSPLDVFERAVRYYRMDIVQRQIWLHRPLQDLFSRSIAALPLQDRSLLLLQMARLPLPGTENCKAGGDSWPDPLCDLPMDFEIPTPVRSSDEWNQAVEALLLEARRVNPTGRSAAVLRLAYLHKLRLLSESEQSQFADALWDYPYNQEGGLPQDSNRLRRWAYLNLPEQEQGQASRAFRREILDTQRLRTAITQCPLSEIASAVSQGSIELTTDESAAILEGLRNWSNNGGARIATLARHPLEAPEVERFRNEFPRELAILVAPCLAPASDDATEFYKTCRNLRDLEYRTEPLTPHLMRLCPNWHDEILADFRLSMASQDENEARAAMGTLLAWLRTAHEGRQVQVPAVLLEDVALAIASRRPSSLELALEVAAWFLTNDQASRHTARFFAYLLVGLAHLRKETDHDPEGRETTLQDSTIPSLRARCARLARALVLAKHGDDAVVQDWLKSASNDPLPEVRLALDYP